MFPRVVKDTKSIRDYDYLLYLILIMVIWVAK